MFVETLGLMPKPDQELEFRQIDPSEVKLVVMQLQNKRSSGPDGLSNYVMRKVCDNLVLPITPLYNLIIECSCFPEQFKVCKIIPLFKGGDPEMVGNYRPISLTNTLSKIFERLIFNQIEEFFTNQSLHDPNQFGTGQHKTTWQDSLDP